MQRYKIVLSYDGTNYYGWQSQPKNISVQSTIEYVLHKLSGETIRVHGSGRTDKGVHARRQVAHFDMKKAFEGKALARAFNALLPDDIRVLSARKVPDAFHARHDVKGKEYRYFIWNSEVLPPFRRCYRTHVRSPLDVPAMRKAALLLAGRHNFRSFCAARYKGEENFVRDLRKLSVSKKGAEIIITAESAGFLYKMVRSITGHLVRVGKGRIEPADTVKILKAANRTQHVETALPTGLFLWNVRY